MEQSMILQRESPIQMEKKILHNHILNILKFKTHSICTFSEIYRELTLKSKVYIIYYTCYIISEDKN